jgi:leucyl/phenylalanyl-tRNA--protein transferase
MLLMGYRQGFFPMAEGNHGKINWHLPDPRAIIPLNSIKIHRSVRQTIKREQLEFKIDSDFETVIRNCAERDECWISEQIIDSYITLHDMGYAHSVEAWKGDEMVGGLYGVSIGGAFFGESMFTRVTNASKAAFYCLAHRMIDRGFILLDSQYINPHTEFLGAIEIPIEIYMKILQTALRLPVTFK